MSDKRDNAYFLQRMKKDAPGVHRDYLLGKYPSVAAARRAAGSLKDRTRLHQLKNAWKKSDLTEKKEFMAWVRSGLVQANFTSDERFTTSGHSRLKRLLADKGMRVADLMSTLGRPRTNTAVSMALSNGTRLRSPTRELVDRWIKKHSAPPTSVT